MKVLITGARGQLGQDVLAECLRRGHEAIGLGHDDLELTDHGAVKKTVCRIEPDAIIHCAAWTNVDGAEDQPDAARAINAEGSRNIAEAAKAAGAKLIYISTDYVFGGAGTRPWQPEDEPSPLNVYGRTKLDGERAVSESTERHFIVRTSWLYGAHGKNFVKTMLRLGRERDTVRVVNDQIGTPTYSADLARLLSDMAESERYGIYHAANTGGYISWYDFAREIYALAGLSTQVIPTSSEEYGAKAKRPQNSRLDTGALTAVGFELLPDWKDALKRYLKETRELGTDQGHVSC